MHLKPTPTFPLIMERIVHTFALIREKPSAHPKDPDINETPYLNQRGILDFASDDIENPKNWSAARKWYVTLVSVSMVTNATFASSAPSGCLQVSCVKP